MLRLLALVVPLALAGAVSPMMLSEQTVLLAGPDGRRVAERYAIGVGASLAAFLIVLVLFGDSISLPTEPRLSATLDIVLGSLLVVLAVGLRVRRLRPRRKKPRRQGLNPSQALGFGVFSMATNFTTLAVMVPVGKEIAASDVGVPARLIVMIMVVIIASAPAWLPIALAIVAPGPTRRGLDALSTFIDTRGPALTMLLLAAVGVFLLARGIVHILGW